MDETTRTLPPYDPWAPRPQPPPASYDPVTGAQPGGPGGPFTPPTASHPAAPARPRRGVAALVAVALAAGLVGGGAGAAVTAAIDDEPATVNTVNALDAVRTGGQSGASDTADGAVERVASAVLPSVVSILVRTPAGGGGGTGVTLSSDGLILTNNHVVESAAQGGSITVTFTNGDSATAQIVGRDPATDLAVIQAEDVSGLTPAQLGSSADLTVGEEVVAIGSPLGLSGTVTSGIVSALNRPVRAGGGQDATAQNTVIDAIQTDAAINPGNSGGPLVNMSGQVVGINSAIATLGGGLGGQSGSIGLGFAIPIDQARDIADQLANGGTAEHAQLGVSVGNAATPNGETAARVASVVPGGGADGGGLRAGDVITGIDDRRVESADALIAAVRSHQPGDEVRVTYLRDGDERMTTVTLGSDAENS